MNAAARLVHQSTLARQLVFTHLLNKQQLFALALSFGVITSALGVIYMTHTTQLLHANYQKMIIEQNRLQAEQRQLLLEKSTLMMQARVQKLAEKKLGMIMPNPKAVVIIKE